jgi:hypothetical protein
MEPMAKKGESGKRNGAAEPSNPQVGQFAFELPISWVTAPEITSKYANHVIIQTGPEETYVSFFEARPPHVTGSNEEVERKAKEIKSIEAKCVARIVMPRSLLAKMTTAFQKLLDQRQDYEAKKGEHQPADASEDRKESA